MDLRLGYFPVPVNRRLLNERPPITSGSRPPVQREGVGVETVDMVNEGDGVRTGLVLNRLRGMALPCAHHPV